MALPSIQPLVGNEYTETETRQYMPALVSLAVLYFMNGFITCLNDTLVPFFKSGFTLSYAASSLVQFYFFLTYGLMSFPSGKIVERVGYKNGMVLGFSVAAVGALLFVPAASLHMYALFLAALFVLAIGIVILQVASNPYITILGPARTASSRLTLIQAVGSIGTTIAPLFGARFILSRLHESGTSSEAVKYPYIGIALLLICIAIVVYRLKLPDIKPPVSQVENNQGIFSFRNLSFGTWAIFAYVGAEVSIGTFLTNYISDNMSIAVKDANSYVSFYWGGMLVGRLIGSYLLKYIKPSLVLATCALAAILLVGISINTAGSVAAWTMIGAGVCKLGHVCNYFLIVREWAWKIYNTGFRHFVDRYRGRRHCAVCARTAEGSFFLGHFFYRTPGMLCIYFVLWFERL